MGRTGTGWRRGSSWHRSWNGDVEDDLVLDGDGRPFEINVKTFCRACYKRYDVPNWRRFKLCCCLILKLLLFLQVCSKLSQLMPGPASQVIVTVWWELSLPWCLRSQFQLREVHPGLSQEHLVGAGHASYQSRLWSCQDVWLKMVRKNLFCLVNVHQEGRGLE